MERGIGAASAAWLLFTAASATAATATIAVVNSRIWTGDSKHAWAEALAVADERILAVGSNTEIRAVTGPGTRVVDGGGAMVTPGFIDAHIHLFVFERNQPFPAIFLRYMPSRQEVADSVATYAAKLPKGAWILGYDWPESLWGAQLPTRAWLDRIAPEHPVWLVNLEGNAGLANSRALQAAGIAADGRSGVVRSGAMWRVEAAQIEGSRERDDRVVEEALRSLLRVGVSSAHHNNSWYEFLILRRLYGNGRLPLRVYASPSYPGWERLRDYIAEFGRGDAWLHWGGIKGYGTITAERYYPLVSGASKAGLQTMVHTGSNDELRILLGVFERVRREQHLADPRFRVEHAHDMPPDAIPMMARAGAIASWQPPLLAHEDQRAAAGQPAAKNLFPCRALLEAGVKIAFGTDSSPWSSGVVPPLVSLQMALERTGPDGSRITFDQALRAHTLDAAYAEFAEKEKGSLEAGKLADFVLFDRDFSRGPVPAIGEARVRMTVIGGRVMYDAASVRK